MSRLTRDRWGLALAAVTAQRSTCLRRSVGCVLVDRDGHVLATGYNGVAPGRPHCNEVREEGADYEVCGNQSHGRLERPTRFIKVFPNACAGAAAPSGQNLDGCEAIHAEQNALLQCRDVREIDICYVTCSPCLTCTKLLLNTGCRRIVFEAAYPAPNAEVLWTGLGDGRTWELFTSCAS